MSGTNGKQSGISRRDFARRAAIAAATAACLPSELFARPADPLPAAPQQADEKLSAESQAEVDAKIQAILGKYGDRFSEAQKADIRRLVTEGQKPLEAMRKFPVENSDQPATVLRLYPDATASRRIPSH
ncbi:MAG: twin-arginine translocation signal domain-containing protein [Candidatus Acidiferrales bacterium]